MKIVFLGTPEFGSIILEGLAKTNFKPILVITASDKPVGRKQIITPPPVKIVSQKYDISVAQPERAEEIKLEIEKVTPDLAIVAAYKHLIPKDILEIPKYGFLNVHPSLLPSWRGASPVQHTILNGDKETGVTIILMDEKIDHGKIIAQSRIEIKNNKITSEELTKEMAELGAKLLIETIPAWIGGEIKPISQDDSKATHTRILTKENGKIDWSKSAEYLERQIRAFNLWPGTFTTLKGKNGIPKTLKIFKAFVLEQTEKGPFGSPGKTYLAPNDKIAVQCGKDFLVVEELQIEGGKRISIKDFLLGHPDFIGITLK